MPGCGEDVRAPRVEAALRGQATRKAGPRTVFVGVHDRQLDDKGRLALPAPFRAELGDRCYLSLDHDGCVTLRETTEFENHAKELIELEKRGELTRSRRRAIATTSSQVSVDKQGRITLEDKLRQHAGLVPGSPVKVVGTFDAIEIWRPERFQTVETEGRDELPPRTWTNEA